MSTRSLAPQATGTYSPVSDVLPHPTGSDVLTVSAQSGLYVPRLCTQRPATVASLAARARRCLEAGNTFGYRESMGHAKRLAARAASEAVEFLEAA